MRKNLLHCSVSATAHTADITIRKLRTGIISKDNQLLLSHDMNPCDYFLWGYLKGKVYKNNSHTLEQLGKNIILEIANIPLAVLRNVIRNVFRRCLNSMVDHISNIICSIEDEYNLHI